MLAQFDLLLDLGARAGDAQPSGPSGGSGCLCVDGVAPAADCCHRLGACAVSSRITTPSRFDPPTLS
jgi:hypothetical protein